MPSWVEAQRVGHDGILNTFAPTINTGADLTQIPGATGGQAALLATDGAATPTIAFADAPPVVSSALTYGVDTSAITDANTNEMLSYSSRQISYQC